MGSKGGRAPPPPDPNVVSAAQTQSNQQTAAYNNALTSGNTTTPFGNQTYTPRTDPVTGATVYDQAITLAPEQQQLLDVNNANSLQLGQAAGGMLGRVRDSYGQPIDTSGLPQVRGAPQLGGYQSNAGQSDQLNVNGPGIQGTLSTDGLAELYGANDLEGARRQTQDALYGRQAAYLDPQWQQRDQSFRTNMANQGIVEGSEAWNNAFGNEDRARSFDYGRARESAIAGGGDELSRLVGIASGNRGQQFGERQAQGGFQNNAQAQALAQALAQGGFANDARMTNASFANEATGAGNRDAMASAGFDNQARGQGLEEMAWLRSLPLNEYNALTTGAQVNAPQFQNRQTPTSANTNTADNAYRSYQGNLDIWNAQQQGRNSFLGGLFGLGSAALSNPAIFASDERLKTDIEPVGDLPQGLGVYDYEYKDEPGKTYTGVMAQEVEKVQPDAVFTMANGYKAVDYKKVMAEALRRSVK